jgi:amidohydrolase
LINSLYGLMPRSIDSRNPAVLTIGKIEGGNAANVISERVLLAGSLRTTDGLSRETLMQRVRSICTGIEHNTGAAVRVQFSKPLPGVDNHPRITAALEAAGRRVVGPENVSLIDRPSMGGEDFAVYLAHVPGAMFRLGCGQAGVDNPFLHSPRFDIDERALVLGARILVRAAWLLALNSRREV